MIYYQFNVYSSRWGDNVTYYLIWNESGWDIRRDLLAEGKCCQSGFPKMWNLLKEDGISFPSTMPDAMEHIWKEPNEKLRKQYLNDTAEWISEIEKMKPEFFKTFSK